MICLDNQPFQLVENTGFKALMNYLEPRYTLPSRKTLSNFLIPQLYEDQVKIVRSILDKSDYISLTTVIWTSTANDD